MKTRHSFMTESDQRSCQGRWRIPPIPFAGPIATGPLVKGGLCTRVIGIGAITRKGCLHLANGVRNDEPALLAVVGSTGKARRERPRVAMSLPGSSHQRYAMDAAPAGGEPPEAHRRQGAGAGTAGSVRQIATIHDGLHQSYMPWHSCGWMLDASSRVKSPSRGTFPGLV